MIENPKIPIKNIYYMLCYAWNVLPRHNEKLRGLEKFDNIYNLLAKLIISDTSSLIKRGFHREYIDYEEELSVLKGKIEVGKSVNQQTIIRKRLVCKFDDFSENVAFNQILKTTISRLTKSSHLDQQLKIELITISYYFTEINEIKLSPQTFAALKYNRNNKHYRMLIYICELLYLGLISNEEDNKIHFSDFIRDEQMATLYEKFVLNFYKKHLHTNKYKTHSPKIHWGLDEEYENVGLEFLPQMRTDIVIENEIDKKQLIIDTKYYASALKKGNYGEIKKLSSGNLYQICTYVNNSSYSGKVSGMLLYPTTVQELNLEYKINGNIIMVKTLNLGSDWENIYERLLHIVSK